MQVNTLDLCGSRETSVFTKAPSGEHGLIKPLIGPVRNFLTSRSWVGATAQIVLANVLILGINLGTGMITARVLGPGGRGEQAAILLWPQLLVYVLTLGLPSALLYNLKRYQDRAPQLFSAALLLGALMGLFATLIGILLIPYWLTEYSPEVVRYAQWAMLVAPAALLGLLFAAVLQAREEFALFNAARYLQPLLILLTLALLAATHRLTPLSAALSYLLAGAPVLLWLFVRLWRLYRPRWYNLRSASKNLLSYGLRSYGMDLLAAMTNQTDRVLLVGLFNPALMGLYVVAMNLARLTTGVFYSAVVSTLFPKTTGLPVDEVAILTGRVARVTTVAVFPIAIGLAFFGPWMLGLFYGREFVDAVTVFRLLILEGALAGTAWVLAQAFMAVGKPGIATIEQMIGFGLSLPLFLLLVPRHGLAGAGIALLISTTSRLIFVIVCFPYILKVRPPRLWPTRTDFETIIELVFRVKGGGSE
jgi:O-antigen/teichoic acid export membrane protein